MFYSIRHVTRFQYSAPVSESVMEVRMRPRTEGHQRALKFDLTVGPRAHVQFYRDYLGNTVHYFDVPGHHTRLSIVAEGVAEVEEPPEVPDALSDSAWQDVDAIFTSSENWEMQVPSHFAKPTKLLTELAHDLNMTRRGDPLSLLRELNASLYSAIEYAPKSTRVDSPIDDALKTRRGVCQDFTHIMIVMVRGLSIPCRYVSGYLFPNSEVEERSSRGATHAWCEALLPGLGWVGFDPTNNILCTNRHIRTAVGRDYADVPPTKGVFKGRASSELSVDVRVQPTDAPADDREHFVLLEVTPEVTVLADDHWDQQQQQQ